MAQPVQSFLVAESPNPEVDFEVINEQKKKVDFSYDKQVFPLKNIKKLHIF